MSRALETIQSDAMRLVTVRILGAIEANEWFTVSRLAEQLQEIAARGMHHSAQARALDVGRFEMGGHQEREPR